MANFHNFAVRVETGPTPSVVKPILKIRNVTGRC